MGLQLRCAAMMRQRLLVVSRRIFRSDFAFEWLAVGALAAVAALWMAHIGFVLNASWNDGAFVSAAVGATLIAHGFGSRRVSLMAEYFTLSVAATVVFGIVSYLAMATPGPLFDAQLLAADRALGFDWLRGFHWLEAHPPVSKVFRFICDSLVYQGLYFGILFALMEKKQDLRQMFWLVFVAGIFTSAGAALFPALGTYKTFALEAHGTFLPDMERLRSGHDLSFSLSKLTGVVSFPSFHTTMALIYIYAFRRMGAVGWLFASVNIAMLFAIPYFGGHYLVDMIAGGCVMLASLCCDGMAQCAHRRACARSAQGRIGEPDAESRKLARTTLGQNALQRAPMHVEAACRLRNIVAAQFVNTLNMLPAHTVGRHWILGRLRLGSWLRHQRRQNVVGVGGFGQIVNGAVFYRGHRGGNISKAGKHHDTAVGTHDMQRLHHVEPIAIVQLEIDHGIGGRCLFGSGFALGHALGDGDCEAARLHRTRQPLT